MIVVSDTTAVTTLLKVGEEQLLARLFGRVVVPPAVWDELLAFHSALPPFIELRRVSGTAGIQAAEILGRGETEAIQLAVELHADWLLLDDRKGRIAAAKLGLRCVALTGLLVRSRQLGHVASIRPLLEKLEQRGGLYLSEAVKEEALRQAGEW
jgi:uncharacterized protein